MSVRLDQPDAGAHAPKVARRSLLKGGAAVAGGAAVLGPLAAAASATESSQSPTGNGIDYGFLREVPDATTGLPLLALPEGFEYFSFGWTGDPLDNGEPTPPAHDGMAAYHAGGSLYWLVRNHEVTDPVHKRTAPTYDQDAGGGNTSLLVDCANGTVVQQLASITGTIRNCAGGPTPYNTWITCEETTRGPNDQNSEGGFFQKTHGYCFEVPGDGSLATANAITDMGRFSHEAVAVDPVTNWIYLTEDANPSGLYLYIPRIGTQPEAGGRLYALRIRGRRNVNLDLTGDVDPADFPLPVRWRRIRQPDPDLENGADSVFTQGFDRGAASFNRLEGAWWGNDRVYFTSTSGGGAGEGVIWAYEPDRSNPTRGQLHLVSESPNRAVMENPDNIVVSPRTGNLVIHEDGGNAQVVYGMLKDGSQIFRFARNNVFLNGERNGIVGDYTNSESAGGTFSDDGKYFFFNIQTPGITFCVKGPWENGAL